MSAHTDYAKDCIQRALSDDDQQQTNQNLAAALFTLATAIEQSEAQPKSAPQPKPQPKKIAAQQPKQTTFWQKLPLPTYLFTKAALLAMLQELMQTVKRA